MINTTPKLPIIGVYKITSPSGKVYIGQSDNIDRRKGHYKGIFPNIQKQVRIYRSLLKYGFDNHIFEIIENCSVNLLNERERYWQEYYNVIGPNGLNCILTKTKDKPLINSEDTKLRKSLAAPTRPVIQYSLNGEIIKEWNRIIDVERQLNIANQTITSVCRGRKNSAGGYIWRYKDSPREIVNPVRSSKNGIPVNQLDLKGGFIKEWPTAQIAGIELGIDNGSIANCCNNKQQTAGKFKWSYKEL